MALAATVALHTRASASARPIADAAKPAADLIVTNARVWTVDASRP